MLEDKQANKNVQEFILAALNQKSSPMGAKDFYRVRVEAKQGKHLIG